MTYPKLQRDIFDNEGAGPKLNASIMPSTVLSKANNGVYYASGDITVFPIGGSEGGQINLATGTDGTHEAHLDNTSNLFRVFGSPTDSSGNSQAYGIMQFNLSNGNLSINRGAVAVTSDIPTKTSQLTNDSGFLTSSSGGAAGVSAYITSTWHSGTSWYRVWSDGFIEQGGLSAQLRSFTTYPKAFSQAVCPVCQWQTTTSSNRGIDMLNYSATGFTPREADNGGLTTANICWYAAGF